MRPKIVNGLDIIEEKNSKWTAEQEAKLIHKKNSEPLFADYKTQQLSKLRKVPFSFYYRYLYNTPEGEEKNGCHKIVDWEAAALYWNCVKKYGSANWEKPFREKLEVQLVNNDLMFLMGNQQRFRNQWLITVLFIRLSETQRHRACFSIVDSLDMMDLNVEIVINFVRYDRAVAKIIVILVAHQRAVRRRYQLKKSGDGFFLCFQISQKTFSITFPVAIIAIAITYRLRATEIGHMDVF